MHIHVRPKVRVISVEANETMGNIVHEIWHIDNICHSTGVDRIAAFSADSALLATGSSDGKLRIFRVDKLKPYPAINFVVDGVPKKEKRRILNSVSTRLCCVSGAGNKPLFGRMQPYAEKDVFAFTPADTDKKVTIRGDNVSFESDAPETRAFSQNDTGKTVKIVGDEATLEGAVFTLADIKEVSSLIFKDKNMEDKDGKYYRTLVVDDKYRTVSFGKASQVVMNVNHKIMKVESGKITLEIGEAESRTFENPQSELRRLIWEDDCRRQDYNGRIVRVTDSVVRIQGEDGTKERLCTLFQLSGEYYPSDKPK